MSALDMNATNQLFLIAEDSAHDFSLFPQTEELRSNVQIAGLLSLSDIHHQLKILEDFDTDSYVAHCVTPAQDNQRLSACQVIQALGGALNEVTSVGPYYSAVLRTRFSDGDRSIGIIAQDRSALNGAWMPEHHLLAVRIAGDFARRSLPIVTLMDTPGANAGEEANRNNQSHAISRLIVQMCNVDVPTVGVILGLGYSGGAIPLAASNMILSVRDGVFNTINPQGLASIARKYSLSWQECAKHVGVSSYELFQQGNIDGVIDYVPGETGHQLENFRSAIVTSIEAIERSLVNFVRDNPYIVQHHQAEIERYLKNYELQVSTASLDPLLNRRKPPAEYPNVFGTAIRHLRYLGIRKRIKSTTKNQYGRLAEREVPTGELHVRTEQEMQSGFDVWMQNPDRVIYDENMARSLKNYKSKKQDMEADRGRVAQFFLGEPKRNYETARTQLLMETTFYLYNRWKNRARDNLQLLIAHLGNISETGYLIKADDLLNPVSILELLANDNAPHYLYLKRQFSHEGRKLLRVFDASSMSAGIVAKRLTSEFNRMIREGALEEEVFVDYLQPKVDRRRARIAASNSIPHSRWLLEEAFPNLIRTKRSTTQSIEDTNLTFLDLIQIEELRDDFISELKALLVFDQIYDCILNNFNQIAREAEKDGALSARSLTSLLNLSCQNAAQGKIGLISPEMNDSASIMHIFQDWSNRFVAMPRQEEFLRSVEEWKKTSFPHLSDTLFVIATFLFEKLIPDYFSSQSKGKHYVGTIRPKRIGRSKDFWNRLTLAYRDLQIQNLLKSYKLNSPASPDNFINEFFENYEPMNVDMLSSNPVNFPGFRLSIENFLNQDIPPCGILTGTADFKSQGELIRMGVVISNPAFQAGAFDMASAEKFCALLASCAQLRIPVVCFISSGGMQTKEGAGALFSMAAVNDRITRFVSDLDLPVIVFGFGDCTGGAQASFVTHPLVHTYYFSGAYMPFAGQIVVSSHLPLTSMLSNYLALVPDSMQGLVQHPFLPEQDQELRKIDPRIPIPEETVQAVVTNIIANRDYSQGIAAVAVPINERVDKNLQPVRRVLIHARGCTAVKIIRTAQKKNLEIVLVQSDPDMDSVAVDMLSSRDRAVCIGGNTPDESYLNGLSVVRIAEKEGVDSLHPGIGFLSENSQFSELCHSHDINFIGPTVASMEAIGNKSNAISTALRLEVPVVPGSHGILTSEKAACELAEQIGFPLLIKAVHGGGGKGIQIVERPEDMIELFYLVQAEAKNAFGNGDVYLEKYITSLRHIEVQLLRDINGKTLVVGLRDCSVQNNKQKVIEESATTTLSAELEEAVCNYSRTIADEIDYLGVGTVEFIHDLKADTVYFMEMNARLQVEHPVTEAVSGVGLVATQFDIAGGSSIEKLKWGKNGCGIEVRVNAERAELKSDGSVELCPAPGKVEHCHFPKSSNIEVISSIASGKTVSPFYDSMVAQVIAHGKNRNDAINKLYQYLGKVKIKGISTNIPLLKKILKDEKFCDGHYDTNYFQNFMADIDVQAFIDEMQEFSGTGDLVRQETLKIEGSDELKVISPATGIIYLTPSPAEAAYVKEGDLIDIKSTLCQIEAMKIFSSISLDSFNRGKNIFYPSDQKYRINRVQYTNGNQVNTGDLLFVVEPAV